jgi:hypothetical protein
MDQVQRYRLPPNFAKETDSRFKDYVGHFGPECWELDALDPSVISALIRSEIKSLIDWPCWETAVAEEAENRALLTDAARNWALVEDVVRGSP